MNIKAYAAASILALLALPHPSAHASGHDHGAPFTIGIDVGQVYLANHAQFCTQMDVNIQSFPAAQGELPPQGSQQSTVTATIHALRDVFKESRRIDCKETEIAPRLHGSFRVGDWLILEGSYAKATGFDFTQSVKASVRFPATLSDPRNRKIPTDAQFNKFYNSHIDGSADFSVLNLAARAEFEFIPAARMYGLLGARRHSMDIEINNVFDDPEVTSSEVSDPIERETILETRRVYEAKYQEYAEQRSRSGTAYLFGGGVEYEVIDDFSTGIYYGVQFEGERQANWKFDMAYHPSDNLGFRSGFESFAGGEMNDVEFWYGGMTYGLDF